MRYKGKSVEIIGSKTLFGKETLWVHVLEDNTFMQVQRTDLVEDDVNMSVRAWHMCATFLSRSE